jgi:hypothetical protein
MNTLQNKGNVQLSKHWRTRKHDGGSFLDISTSENVGNYFVNRKEPCRETQRLIQRETRGTFIFKQT